MRKRGSALDYERPSRPGSEGRLRGGPATQRPKCHMQGVREEMAAARGVPSSLRSGIPGECGSTHQRERSLLPFLSNTPHH